MRKTQRDQLKQKRDTALLAKISKLMLILIPPQLALRIDRACPELKNPGAGCEEKSAAVDRELQAGSFTSDELMTYSDALGRAIGFYPQSARLFPQMSVDCSHLPDDGVVQ